MEELTLTTPSILFSSYNIKDMLSMRYNFKKEISVPFNEKVVKYFISSSYKQEAVVLETVMDERIRLMELSSFPTIKKNNNEI